MAFEGAAKSGFSLEDLAAMGPDELERRRKLAEALIAANSGIQDIKSPWQGAAQLANALVGNLKEARYARAEAKGKEGANSLFSAAMGLGAFPPAPGGGASGSASASPSAAPPSGSGGYRDAIAGIESGGRYDIVGKSTKGDRPYGKYQVMGANVGPWTEQVLGKRMTPQEFLASPEAQDKVFDSIFNGYVQKYGPEGAAQAWFGGPGGVGKVDRKDVLGTSIGDYGKQFLAGIGGAQPPAPVQVASNDPQAGIAQALIEQGIAPNSPQAQAFAGLQQGAGAAPAADGTIPQPMPPSAQGASPVAGQAQIAQALVGGDRGLTMGAPPIQPGGPDLGTLMNAGGNEFMNPAQQRMIEALLGQRLKQADPENQLDLEIKRAQLNAARRPPKAWQKLDDDTLFDPISGEIKELGAGAGSFKFGGSSVEAQGLNYLIQQGKLTPEQAAQIGAGKTITDPTTGAVIFMTPSGIAAQMPGGQPQLVKPPQGGDSVAPAPSSASPAAPVDPNAPTPQLGIVPITGPKVVKPTEQQNRSGSLYHVTAPDLKRVEENFAALGELSNQIGGMLPDSVSNYATTPQYQRANNALQAIIASYLYSTSGATANPGEVVKQANMLTPRPGEDKASVADKLDRIRTMVEAIRLAAGPAADATTASAPSAPAASGDGWKEVAPGLRLRPKVQ